MHNIYLSTVLCKWINTVLWITTLTPLKWLGKVLLSMDLKEAQMKGGRNSRKNLTPEKRHELAIKAAKASARTRKVNKKMRENII